MADLASRITGDQPAAAAEEDHIGDDGAEDFGASGLAEPEYEVEVTLNELQNNESTPFHSANTWEQLGLAEPLHRGLLALNFQKPSKIQGKALPIVLNDPPHHLLAQSQSGTGKTAAFVVAILSRIDFSRPDVPQALVLAPSRELARQIEDVITAVGRFCEGLVVKTAIPGNLPRGQKVNANVIVGTPGTVMDITQRRQLDARELKVLVLDEADNMLDSQGLGDQCLRVKRLLPPSIQVLLFSATFPENVMSYAEKFAPNAHTIKLQRNDLTVRGISQMFMDCSGDQDKYNALCKLYGVMTIGQSVIFVRTRESANQIASRMENDGHSISVLHADFEGPKRDEVLGEFRARKTKVLITTNVLARGIDVSSVSMVINYDIPMKGRGNSEPDYETYLHRIGRTGRFGRIGVSISFVYDRRSYEALQTIAQQYSIDLVQLGTDDWDATEKRINGIIKKNRAQASFAPHATEKIEPQAEPQAVTETKDA
jgi:ATP-dependent RNA helicase DDX19/DBP5